MLKGYRGRFVAVNMALVSVVLLAAFLVLGFISYQNTFEQMKQTMSMIVRPWSEPGDNFRLIGERPGRRDDDRTPPEGAPEGERPEGEAPRDVAAQDEGILTVFYNRETDEVSIVSDGQAEDQERIRAAVAQTIEEEGAFGSLPAYGLYYYKETTAAGYKIALAENGYLTVRVAGQALWMALLFAALLVLFFFISLFFAKIAARPMEKAVEMERRFVADISHDLKTPITVILANNSILKSSASSTVEELMQWIDSTGDAAAGMMGLVNEMLTLSSLETPDRRVEKKRVSFTAAAEKSALQLESLAYERGVSIESNLEKNVFVAATADYLERICTGLIENALKYEPVGGTVSVTLGVVRHKATLTVSNAGSVISPEDLPHVFERFYRADKTRGTRDGHGLGLPIVKQMIDLLGGSIGVVSSREEGTAFTVSFEKTE